MTLAEIIAQAPEWWTPLLNGGSAAAVLGPIVIWFAMRLEKMLEKFQQGIEKLREATERNSHALMVSVLNTRHLDDALKPIAEQLERDTAEAIKHQ